MALSAAPQDAAALANRFEMHYEKYKEKIGFRSEKGSG